MIVVIKYGLSGKLGKATDDLSEIFRGVRNKGYKRRSLDFFTLY